MTSMASGAFIFFTSVGCDARSRQKLQNSYPPIWNMLPNCSKRVKSDTESFPIFSILYS